MQLIDKFVPHRNYGKEFQGGPIWKSLCLKGLNGDSTKTLYHTDYQINEPKFALTEIADLCPRILEFLNSFTDVTLCQRIRLMLLEPGAKIHVHRDRATDGLAIGINVALNNPPHCNFIIDTDELGKSDEWTRQIPFRPGTGMIINVGKYHYVENNSSENRIHMIIDGPIRYSKDQLVALANGQNGIGSMSELVTRVLCKRALQGKSLESSESMIHFGKSYAVIARAISSYVSLVVIDPQAQPNELNDELMNMTTGSLYPADIEVCPEATIDSTIERLRFKGAKNIAVIRAGTFIPIFWNFIYQVLFNFGEMKRRGARIAGHIIDFQDDEFAPHFHEQMTLFRLCDQSGPLPQLRTAALKIEFPPFERSAENFHDQYTPYWLRSKLGSPKMLKPKWCSQAIAESLSTGHEIMNLSPGLRATKQYSYFEKSKSPELALVRKRVSDDLEIARNTAYIFNNEPLHLGTKWPENFRPEVLLSVAAGLKPFALLNSYWPSADPAQIFFFDFSARALQCIQELTRISEWTNFAPTIKTLASANNHFKGLSDRELYLRAESALREGFAGQPQQLMHQLARGRTARFEELNFLSDWRPILNALVSRPKFIFWHSNAWNNKAIHLLRSPAWLRRRYQTMVGQIAQQYELKAWLHKRDFEALIGPTFAEPTGIVTHGAGPNFPAQESDYELINLREQQIDL